MTYKTYKQMISALEEFALINEMYIRGFPMSKWVSFLKSQSLKSIDDEIECWKNLPIERAHTYSSENADVYRAYDNGQEAMKEKIISHLQEQKRLIEEDK